MYHFKMKKTLLRVAGFLLAVHLVQPELAHGQQCFSNVADFTPPLVSVPGSVTEISGSITLSANDQNENNEGECLTNVTDNFGLYKLAKFCNYDAPLNFTIEIPNSMFQGGIVQREALSGFYTSDTEPNNSTDSCSITLNAPHPHIFATEWKEFCNEFLGGDLVWGASMGSDALALTLLTKAPGLFAGTATLGLGTAAVLAGCYAIAKDPPDNSFNQIANPQPLVPAVPKVTGLPKPTADAFNAEIGNELEAYGYLSALSTTLNRAIAASIAGDQQAVDKQVNQGNDLTAGLAVLLLEDVLLRQSTAAALVTAGLDVTITPAQALQIESQYVASGLPAALLNLLSTAGIDQETINSIGNLVVVQDPNLVAGPLSGALYNAGIASALQTAARDLAGVCYQADLVQASLGSKTGDPLYNPAADLNGDGIVNGEDLEVAIGKLAAGTDCHIRNL